MRPQRAVLVLQEPRERQLPEDEVLGPSRFPRQCEDEARRPHRLNQFGGGVPSFLPPPGRGSTWITPEFLKAYTQLHEQGHAHSLECWQGEQLVDGIYGLAIGGFFAGESMFHRVSHASKIALFHLVEHLRRRDFALFDIQMLTPVTSQMGGVTIPREEYLERLAEAVEQPCSFS